jgi:hypothetical protein
MLFKKIVLKKIVHSFDNRGYYAYIKSRGSKGIWDFYYAGLGAEDMSYVWHRDPSEPQRIFYFSTPTQKMKAIPNTFSRNFHGAMHSDTGVMGWMPNIEI